jgi:diphthamide synthase (EF-2-diphthine--ammonia ligase)
MKAALARYRQAGVSVAVCGDIFLEDVRRYREDRLFTQGLRGAFPLWKRDTADLAQRFLTLGFQAVLCCVDTTALGQGFAGRLYDHRLLADLPAAVDPCGENGEFHTFVFDGPTFSRPIEYTTGEHVLRDDRFCYCDLLPRGG